MCATNIVMKMKVGEKMKARNSWPFLAVWLLCFALLAGCALKPDPNVDLPKVSDAESDDMKEEDSELTVLRKNILDSESNIGVAFIDYVDSESTEADLYTYLAASETGQKYPCLSEAPLVMVEGQELYAIVPPNEEWTVTVYPSMITDDGTYEDVLNDPIYTGDPGEVLLVRCNLSEIYSNVLIVSTDGVAAISFRPSLSMEDGHLVAIAGVYDFSVYEEGGSIIESDDEMLENPGLKALREEILQNGTFGAAFIGYVGYDSTGADLYDYLEYSVRFTSHNEYYDNDSLVGNDTYRAYRVIYPKHTVMLESDCSLTQYFAGTPTLESVQSCFDLEFSLDDEPVLYREYTETDNAFQCTYYNLTWEALQTFDVADDAASILQLNKNTILLDKKTNQITKHSEPVKSTTTE